MKLKLSNPAPLIVLAKNCSHKKAYRRAESDSSDFFVYFPVSPCLIAADGVRMHKPDKIYYHFVSINKNDGHLCGCVAEGNEQFIEIGEATVTIE